MDKRLDDLRKQLAAVGATVSVRGSSAAKFIFAEQNGRAIEASLRNNDWWIEFWEADDDEDAAPVDERTVSADSDAFRESAAWLTASGD
jgi:hypothetical protein